MSILKSALFVDFDNIYLCLRQQDQRLADSFAEHPERWLQWLEDNVLMSGRGYRHRDFLVRKCYLNPTSFSRFRPYFIKSAFSVVDCPTLTSQGKNSADIHMVLDIMEALDKTNPSYDEFVIFSGDTDFRPVLIKLRENARLTTVLTVGSANLAYKAAASALILEERFIEEALSVDVAINMEMESGKGTPLPDDVEIRQRIAAFIVKMVRDSSTPTVIASIGDAIRRNFSDDRADDWFGEGRLKTFLASLALDGLEMSLAIPGYVYDPSKHTLPEKDAINPFRDQYPAIYDLAKQVHQLTETPLLPPETYATLFKELAAEVGENGYALTETSRNLRDRCVAKGAQVSRQHVSFVLVGLNRAKYVYKKDGSDKPEDLAKSFAENVYNMCLSAQMEMSEDQRKNFFAWLMSATV